MGCICHTRQVWLSMFIAMGSRRKNAAYEDAYGLDQAQLTRQSLDLIQLLHATLPSIDPSNVQVWLVEWRS